MGRIYTGFFENVAITAVQDLFSVQVPADVLCRLWEFGIFQTSDVGDAAEEILRIRIRRQTGAFTVGSGGSAVTMVRAHEGDAATSLTVRANDTTPALATFEDLPILGWNVRIPLEKLWTPESAPTFFASSELIIDLPAAPSDSLTTSGYITVEELG